MGYYVTGTITATAKVTVRVLVQDWEFHGLADEDLDLDLEEIKALAEGYLHDHAQITGSPTENGSVLCATVVDDRIVCDFEMDVEEEIEIKLNEDEYRHELWDYDAQDSIQDFTKHDLKLNTEWDVVELIEIDVTKLSFEGAGEDGQEINKTLYV
jgi:hypothetical protein